MPLPRANITSGRSRSRSPAQPPPVSQSPRQFLPPSHYAEAGGFMVRENNSYIKDNSEHQGTLRSTYMPYLSPVSNSSNDTFDLQSNSPHREYDSKPESRKRRESQISMVESQLLPSLRDTIVRMTRPPPQNHSKAGSTTPTFKISSEFDSVWPVVTETTSPWSDSHPHTSQSHLTVKHTPDDSSSSSEPTTPKQTHSMPKSVLKSALRSPNPRNLPEYAEASLSGTGATIKSVRSLLRRKSSAISTVENNMRVEPKVPVDYGALEPPEAFSVTRTSGRNRSRTDPGFRPHVPKSSEDTLVPLLNTPQPTSSYDPKSFASNIPRLRGNRGIGTRGVSDDSDLEYRLELEARRRRRLTVINAKIPPASSSSESEVESIVLSPATDVDERSTIGEGVVGLGLEFADHKGMDGIDLEVHQRTATHSSIHSCASVTSIYTEDESKESALDAEVNSTHQSADLDMKHNRRRETLLGLVRGLDLYPGGQQPITSGEESEYNGEPGLAVSGSGDIQTRSARDVVEEDFHAAQSDSESEYEQEPLDNEEIVEDVTHRLRSKFQTPSTPLVPSLSRRQGSLLPRSSKTESGTKRSAQYPRLMDKKEAANTVSKRKTFRLEPVSKSQPNSPSSLCNSSLQRQPVVRDSFTGYDSVVIAKKSREAAARGREAFGIPPSESDEVYHTSSASIKRPNKSQTSRNAALPHIDSVMSNIDNNSWDNDTDDGQLSTGAEALFRDLGGGGRGGCGRYDATDTVDKEQRHSITGVKSGEVEVPRKSTQRARSRTASPPCVEHKRIRQDKITKQGHRETPFRESWRSTVSSSTYSSLLHQHGELEIKRQKIIWELYRSEVDCVEKLSSVVQSFILPLRVQNSKTWISGVPLEITKIFDWLEDILTLHTQIRDTLTSIQAVKRPIVDLVAEPLYRLVPKLEIYQPYLVKVGEVSAMLQRLLDDSTSDFGEFVRLQEKEIGEESQRLMSILEEPTKRVGFYAKVFKELLEATPKTHNDYFSTLILVHSTNITIKVLNEVKTREDEYAYIKSISERISGLPHKISIPHRERHLLCQGQLNLVQKSTSSSTVPEKPLPSSPSSTRTSRLASAIQEWNAGRARSESDASNATFTSTNTASTCVEIHKSPLSEQFSSKDRALHLQDRSTYSPNPASSNTSIQAFLFSDLLVLTQPCTRRSSSKTREKHDDRKDRWNLLENIGLSRVLDVLVPDSSEQSHGVIIDILPIANTDESGARVRTLHLDFPQYLQGYASPIKGNWISSLRQSSKFTVIAMSDPGKGERYLTTLNDTLDKDSLRILDTFTASGLPVPKSPSMQLDGVESELIKLEREERGWWSMRFQQVLKEVQFEERYSHGLVA
ncbi:hypothetical protein L218DRAFT_1074471 [Marasmius fiardii PR-910]|nr:hypothetical protein L218DRAFT_1074471 [Marasmius fiardii PR-910]